MTVLYQFVPATLKLSESDAEYTVNQCDELNEINN